MMIGPDLSRYINPYQTTLTTREKNMIKLKKQKSAQVKSKGQKKRDREHKRLEDKRHSPGVPPNTCPYIDLTITMIKDIAEAYDRLRTKGEHNPMVDKIEQQACDMLDTYVRTSNETLRDNSAYWYGKYKELLKKH